MLVGHDDPSVQSVADIVEVEEGIADQRGGIARPQQTAPVAGVESLFQSLAALDFPAYR
jgi:hypothetical protein